MNNKHYIGKRAKSVVTGSRLPPVTGVVLNGDNDAVFVAGDESGQVLETFVPTATQQMAVDILNRVRGFEYQGYTARNAYLPPTIELGDGITVGGVYGVLASREYAFTPKLTETVSAPYENEEDHEYNYTGNYAQSIANKVQQGQLYYGTRISKQNGLEIVKTDGNIEKSRVILNSDTLAFYNDNGQESFYFDSPSGVFRLTQYADVEDALDGSQAFSQLELTAYQLRLELNDAKGNIASLQLTAQGLQTQITDNKNQLSSTISQTAREIRAELADTEKGLNTTISVTAQGLQTQITGLNGSMVSLGADVDSLWSDMYGYGGAVSSIRQYVNNISLSVTNNGMSSTIYLDSGRTEISSATVVISGAVTFTDLSTSGWSTINGDNITTGSLNAWYVNLKGEFSVYEGTILRGYLGVGYGDDGVGTTYGVALNAAGGTNYLIATHRGVRMTAGGNDMFVTAGGCYASKEIAAGSDRRLKSDISYDMEKYKKLLLNLKPAHFKMIDDSYGLVHTGYVAQDLEDTMRELGMQLEEFAGLAYIPKGDDKRYYIRYGEFIAIAASLLQEYEQRITVLEGKV